VANILQGVSKVEVKTSTMYGKVQNKLIFTNKINSGTTLGNEILDFKVLKILNSNEWHLLW